jgi:hypothetical protein
LRSDPSPGAAIDAAAGALSRPLAARAHDRPTCPRARAFEHRAWTAALLAATALVGAYLILAPPAGDLAAATYRSELFARVGFSTWDTGWYAAHGYWLPSYSLLSPALGALLGVRLLLALSALAATALFALIAERLLPRGAARAAAVVFALGVSVGVLSGRVPFDLGAAIGLAAVLALLRGRTALAAGLAALCGAASPVAGAFLALAGLAGAAGAWRTRASATGTGKRPASASAPSPGTSVGRAGTSVEPAGTSGLRAGSSEPANAKARTTRAVGVGACLALAAASLAPVLILSVAYPNGGYEPFAPSAFWPSLAAVVLIALLLPRGPLSARTHATLRAGAALYALGLVAAYAARTPMGGNAVRLGPLLAPALLVGVLWPSRRGALALLALPLLYWQLATPVKDYVAIAGDPSVHASYYAPLLGELRRLSGGRATIVEVPLTRAHWEAAYLPWHAGVRLARGWERQLDTRYAALFYRGRLSAAGYRDWLTSNHVRYVALPDTPLDPAGAQEGALIARGVPYLRELWRSSHWRLYRFGG